MNAQPAVTPDSPFSVQPPALNVPSALVVNSTLPVGEPALGSDAVIVAVQSATSPTVTGAGLHDTVVVVVTRSIATVVSWSVGAKCSSSPEY